MSDTIQADTAVAKLIDGYAADDRGSALGAPYWMEAALGEIKTFMAMDIPIDGVPLPRYGVLSLLLRSTPCFVYAHPEFKKICRTAFTDGVHVFICEDLMEKLIKEEDASKGVEDGLVPLLMHELSHKLMNHHQRLRSYPRGVANKAADLSINSRLQLGFPELTWVPSLRETGLAFKPGEKEKYSLLSEESIARDLYQDEINRKQQQQKKDGKGNPQKGQGQGAPSPGQGQGEGEGEGGGDPSQGQGSGGKPSKGKPGKPGQGQPGGGGNEPGDQGDPSQGKGGGKGAKEEDQPTDFGADGDEHMPDLEEIVDIMKRAGMTDALAKLGIKNPDDIEEIGRVQRENNLDKEEAINKAAAQAAEHGGKYPGAHIAHAAADMIVSRAKGKLNWKMALREMILGNGGRFRPSMEESSSIYYIDEIEDILGTRPWLPVELAFKPQETVLVLIDTSGSVSDEDIRAFLAEIFELKTASSGFGDAASEVIVLSADTVLRGEPQVITDSNIDEIMANGLRIFGRGGTEFVTSIRQATELDMFKGKNIKSLLYFTDLFANPPKSKEQCGLKEDVNVVFVAAPSTGSGHVAEFAKDVEGWARVTEIREGLEVDMSETSMEMPVMPSQRRRPGA